MIYTRCGYRIAGLVLNMRREYESKAVSLPSRLYSRGLWTVLGNSSTRVCT